MRNDTLKNAMPDFLAEAYAKSVDCTRRKLGNAFGRIKGTEVKVRLGGEEEPGS